jgi:hypothetical protein
VTTVLFPFVQGRIDPRTLTFIHSLYIKGVHVVWADVGKCHIAYGLYLAGLWGKDDLIVIEHDVGVTSEMFEDMLNCPYPFVCAQRYQVHPASTYSEKSFSCQFNVVEGHGVPLPKNSGMPFCDHSGFGFIKFTKAIQLLVPMVYGDWKNIDIRWCRKARSLLGSKLIHVHYPEMKHYHGGEVT